MLYRCTHTHTHTHSYNNIPFTQHLVNTVKYSVIQIQLSLSTITLLSSVTTPAHNTTRSQHHLLTTPPAHNNTRSQQHPLTTPTHNNTCSQQHPLITTPAHNTRSQHHLLTTKPHIQSLHDTVTQFNHLYTTNKTVSLNRAYVHIQ